MSVDRQQVIAAARTLLGTPFHHQGRLAGVGLDCAGVPIVVARTLGLVAPDFDVPPYSRWPDGHTLQAQCDAYMRRVDRAQPGDVLLIAWGQQAPAQHLGIVTPYWHGGLAFVHAEGLRWRCVIETRLMPGRALSILQAYALPGIT